jgi:hypothetical protein
MLKPIYFDTNGYLIRGTFPINRTSPPANNGVIKNAINAHDIPPRPRNLAINPTATQRLK